MTSDDFQFVTRHQALITDDYDFELDEYRRGQGDCFLLAHILVKRWAPSVCKRIKHDWGVLRQCVTAPIFAVPKEHDARWEKFVGMLGFKPFQQTICNNGAQRPLYIHVIKDNVVRERHNLTILDEPVGSSGRGPQHRV